MEKRKPSYLLSEIKSTFDTVEKLRMTQTALLNALEVGMGRVEVVSCVQQIEARHFYKSMTSDRDHRVWQDVYYVPWEELILYVKFTRTKAGLMLIISFKER